MRVIVLSGLQIVTREDNAAGGPPSDVERLRVGMAVAAWSAPASMTTTLRCPSTLILPPRLDFVDALVRDRVIEVVRP